MPGLRAQLSEEETAFIVKMHDEKKSSFKEIAKELKITPEKAKTTYSRYYYAQAVKLVERVQAKGRTYQDKLEIWNYYFKKKMSPKKRYEMLREKYPEL